MMNLYLFVYFTILLCYTAAQVELRGQHVCTRYVEEMRHVQQNITFPCWKQHRISGSICTNVTSSDHDLVISDQQLAGPATQERTRDAGGRELEITDGEWSEKEEEQTMEVRDHETTSGDRKVVVDDTIDTGRSRILEVTDGSKIDNPTTSVNNTCVQHRLEVCWQLMPVFIAGLVPRKHCCPGYNENGEGRCDVVSTCQSNNGGCQQICVNDEINGHRCQCFDGYKSDPVDPTKCIDIDECQIENGGCDDMCNNTDGSYYCSCQPGFHLVRPHHCADLNECLLGISGCEHFCVNTRGSYYCQCHSGYDLKDGRRCEERTAHADKKPTLMSRPSENPNELVNNLFSFTMIMKIVLGVVCGLILIALLILVFALGRHFGTSSSRGSNCAKVYKPPKIEFREDLIKEYRHPFVENRVTGFIGSIDRSQITSINDLRRSQSVHFAEEEKRQRLRKTACLQKIPEHAATITCGYTNPGFKIESSSRDQPSYNDMMGELKYTLNRHVEKY